MRARTAAVIAGVFLIGCLGPPVPQGVIDDVAPKLCALGHPSAAQR